MVISRAETNNFDRPKTYYEILGITPDAGPRDIKSAYLTLAKHFHPDHNTDINDRRMIELNLIYDVLSHPDKKKEYDEKFAQATLYDFSNSKKEKNTGEREQEYIVRTTPDIRVVPKPENIVTRQINYLKIIRIGLTVILFMLLFYLTFYLAVWVLQFTMDLPEWILIFIPKY